MEQFASTAAALGNEERSSGHTITVLAVEFLQRLHKSMLQASWAGLSKQLPGLLDF